MYTEIYEDIIKGMAFKLSKDYHLRKDLEQEMRMALCCELDKAEATETEGFVVNILRYRAINFLRKFYRGEIPYGSMENIEELLEDKILN